MNNQLRLKLVGYFILAILLLNLVLFAFRIIGTITFWGIIIFGAVFVWKVLPWLKKRLRVFNSK